jgi:hypothetical protein
MRGERLEMMSSDNGFFLKMGLLPVVFSVRMIRKGERKPRVSHMLGKCSTTAHLAYNTKFEKSDMNSTMQTLCIEKRLKKNSQMLTVLVLSLFHFSIFSRLQRKFLQSD